MKELKAPDKVTQKMTHDGAVTENLATGEVTNISQREPEVDLSASSEEPASAAVDLAARAAEHHTHLSAKKQVKADDKAIKEGSAARRRPSSRLQFTDEEHADPAMKKYIDRSDKAADKLDKAKAAIPTKKVIRKERTFDETTGKGKTRLCFEEVEKKPNGKLHHSPLSRPMQELRATAHSKIRQVEQDNVGVEAGHKGELLSESAVSYTGSKARAAIRHHKTKPWRDVAKAEQASIKANAEYLYQKALHDDPALAASNPVSRFMQKQRIKRNYAKEVRKTGQNTKKAAQTAKSAAIRAKEAAKRAAVFVKSNWKVILIVVAIAAVVFLLIGGISSCTMMLGSGSGTIMGSSYLSEDADMYAAENAYLSMEASTQHILDNLSSYYPGYDEYNVSADSMGHDPYILISILSALHEGIFTINDVQGELSTLFELQYELTVEAVTETRYRTETRIGSYTYIAPETEETVTEYYEYEVEVPYDKLGEYVNLDELNYLASRLDEMTPSEYEQFQAAIEIGDHTRSLGDLINLTYNLDCYDVYPGIHDHDDLGRYYIEELGAMEIPSYLESYFDYEAYGRDVALEEGGEFTDFGYVRDTGDRFYEEYDGQIESIPEEYRVMNFEGEEPELTMDDKMDMATDLAFDLDEFFRQHDPQYAAQHPEPHEQKELIADLLLERKTAALREMLEEMAQTGDDVLPGRIAEYERETGYDPKQDTPIAEDKAKLIERPEQPDDHLTGERIQTPRGSFALTDLSKEQMEAAGYGVHHQSDDRQFLIMGNGTRAFAVVNAEMQEKENPLKTAEMTVEDDYAMIDGQINNGKREETKERPSIRERLAEAKRECAERPTPEKAREGRGTPEHGSL